MIADHTIVHTVWQSGITLALAATAFGFLYSQFRQGKVNETRNAIAVASDEIEVLQGRNERLERDLKDAREKCAVDIARLEGVVGQLQDENARLQSLVMGETVPPALGEYIKGAAQRNVDNYTTILDERLRPILQALDRLTTKGGEEV